MHASRPRLLQSRRPGRPPSETVDLYYMVTLFGIALAAREPKRYEDETRRPLARVTRSHVRGRPERISVTKKYNFFFRPRRTRFLRSKRTHANDDRMTIVDPARRVPGVPGHPNSSPEIL